MEELKLLIEMVKGLPTLAIWVLIGFFIYKTIIIGSVYGVLKLGIRKLHDVLIEHGKKAKDEISKLDNVVIKNALTPLLMQISRINQDNYSNYIHASDVRWLKTAIDNQIIADKKAKK